MKPREDHHRYLVENFHSSTKQFSWQEQESHSCATKGDKIIQQIYAVEDNDEDKLITISIVISTGPIKIQGMKFVEWSREEFPTLLSMVNSLECSGDPSSKNSSLFLMALPISGCRNKLNLSPLYQAD